MTRIAVADNVVAGCGQGIVMSLESRGVDVRIASNEVIDTGTGGGDGSVAVFGIMVLATLGGQVVDNTVRRVALDDPNAQWRAGIQAIACGSVRIAGNRVSDIGPTEFGGLSVGIGSTTGFDTLDVVDNIGMARREGDAGRLVRPHDRRRRPVVEVHRGGRQGRLLVRRGLGGVARISRPTGRVSRSGATTWTRLPADRRRRQILFAGLVHVRRQLVPPAPGQGERVVVGSASKARPLTALAAATNQVRQPSQDGTVAIDAWVQGAVEPKPNLAATVVGNITDGAIHLNGAVLPPPWRPINVRLS